MKSKSYVSILSIATLLLLLSVSSKICASDYTISFSGTGASTSVENVIVQNLTKGTTVTVPAGNVLALSDGLNAINLLTENNESLKIYPNPINDKATISFNSKSSGITQVNVLALDGRKMVGIIKNINEGVNLFQLTLPRGAYTLQVTGIGFSNSTKVISQSSNFTQPNIIFIDSKKADTLQKSKSAVTPMTYTTGDLLLFKAFSGNYTSVLKDIITGNKTINFNFVECKDVDGNYYSTVTIGNQVWMAENLKTSKYRSSIAITDKTNITTWGTSTTEALSDYATPTNSTTYGKLYNWYAVSNPNNLAPVGWHIPTDADWTSLSDFLGGLNVAGDKLKETGNSHWATANTTATNETGFTALPGGSRSTDNTIYDIGNVGYWWSITEGTTTSNAWYRSFSNQNGTISRGYFSKSGGMSVRCLMGDLPILTTTNATSITASGFVSGGGISFEGNFAVTAGGICWSTSPNPTINDSKTSDWSGTGTYTSTLTGLSAQTTYYVRAYATNSYGTGYGPQLTVSTALPNLITSAVSSITTTTATGGGTVSLTSGAAAVTDRGVCWSTSPNPTIALSTKTSDASGTGTYSSSMTGLIAETTYYVRAYATNNVGTSYGSQVSFSTKLPTLTTSAVSAITSSTAACGGNITNIGGAAVTARGVCWSTSSNPTIINSKTSDSSGSGTYTSSITGLTTGLTYYVRAYATNSIGTIYGNQVSFSTLLPTITTSTVSAITANSATCGGEVTSIGGASVTARGICWGTTSNPTISNNKTIDASGLGVFVSSITGLTSETTYYVRAYATSSIGTIYGTAVTFSTKLATVTTTDVSNITATTVNTGGNVTAIGGVPVTVRGVCWSTTSNPTISNTKTSDGSGTGSFISSVTGLTIGTTYYLRAYATNSIGTAYGTQVIFSTALPSITTKAISSITANSAISGGNITLPTGASAVTDRGVCWSTNQNPTIADVKTSVGNGVGIFTSSLLGLDIGKTYYVRAYATNSVGTSYGNQLNFYTRTPPSSYSIGTAYLGGKIAYIDASGEHGFVCALADQSASIQWYNGSDVTVGATNTLLQTSGVYGISKSGGQKNTDAIIASQGVGTYAASICAALTTGEAVAGDWYLPSIGELNQLYINKTLLGGFADEGYWSSSEYYGNTAWFQSLYIGYQGENPKYSGLKVRAIRAF